MALLPGEVPPDIAEQPYEVVRPEAAWCGPRVLYFLACYLGQDCTLDDVVSRCKTDPGGYTTFRNLVQAARSLDLEPTAIECDVEQLLALGGPAIIGVGRPQSPGAKELRLHFVGLIGRYKDTDRYLVIDPSLRTEPLAVPRKTIISSFSGHAILLRGCPRPWIWPDRECLWLSSLLLAAGVGTLFAFVCTRRFRRAVYLPLERKS